MNQEPMSLTDFQKEFRTKKSCQKHLFKMRWPEGYKCPKCEHNEAYFMEKRMLYQCKKCKYQVSLTAGTIFHGTRVPLVKWFWMIFLISRQKSVATLSLQKMLSIGSYKTAWLMAHKIRKAMAERDANYRLAGLLEMDDAHFGKKNDKDRVVVAVPTPDDKPTFALLKKVDSVDIISLREIARDRFADRTIVRSDGNPAYKTFNLGRNAHLPVVVGSHDSPAHELLPWVHTLIGNIKGYIRGFYHRVASKHLNRYLSEFCYKFNRRFWEPQLFNRLLCACTTSVTITFAELSK